MTPEEKARQLIDARLAQSGWVVQDLKKVNPMASLGVAVREYPTSTGPVDYALFVDGKPVGVIEAKKDELGENITVVEGQSGRYANSTFKYITTEYKIRFAYEATGQLTRFTDYADIKYRSRRVFSFHRPETLLALLTKGDTIRNNMKHFPAFDTAGFRKCQITAIRNLDASFADNRPKALVQMATGAGKTFTAITAAYRLLKFGKMKRILFLVDTKSLGEQAEREFLAYTPNDDNRSFAQLYGVRRLNSSYIPNDIQICISTIQRMYSILKGEEMDESAEEESFFEQAGADTQAAKEVVYNEKYPPEFFDCIIVDECHRSIYNVWNQVLEYFDAFIIGLTATPDKRTFAFFNQNVVSEYSREQAIIDGVNVGEDIFLIETDITQNGATILKQQIEYRDRLTRAKRWKQMDEDLIYTTAKLDRDVVNVAMGAKDEDTLTSLANRVIRLNSQMTDRERTEFSSTVGSSAGNIAQRLLDAFDPDIVSSKAGVDLSDDHEPTEDEQRRMDEAKKALIQQAVQPFYHPDIRDYIENVRRSHEQVIDSVNIDTVLFAGYDTDKQANADRILKTFHAFIEENKDEILALRIIYDQRYKDRPMVITKLKALYEKLKAQNITIERLWECYAIKKPEKVKRGTVAQLTDLISIIRFEMGYADHLAPFADKVNYNFMQWTLRRNAGHIHFTDEQMEWLRLIKDHIAVSLSIEPEDLDLSPFDRKGGLGRFYDVFGDSYEAILQEMNVELVA